MSLKRLPVFRQRFSEMIDDNYLYADKTSYIYDLTQSSDQGFFLCRPRRFGRTQLLSVFKELFTGNRQRFQGLWIERSDYSFPALPTILFDLSSCFDDLKDFNDHLVSSFTRIAERAGVKVQGKTASEFLLNLIKTFSQKSNSKVAVLIDEYNTAVTSNMDHAEFGKKGVAHRNADILGEFLATLSRPDVEPYIRFTLVTAIARFGLSPQDLAANHLTDISLDPRYSGICGFTREEFDSLFTDRLAETLAALKKEGLMDPTSTIEDLKQQIIDWYGGYSFDGEVTVFHPFSVIHFFKSKSFGAHWNNLGVYGYTPPFIQRKPLDFLLPTRRSYPKETLTQSDIIFSEAVSVLFYSGQLTIDTAPSAGTTDPNNHNAKPNELYSFRFPNREITSSYFKRCVSYILGPNFANNLPENGAQLRWCFEGHAAKMTEDLLSEMFTVLSWGRDIEDEKTFIGLVWATLKALGFTVNFPSGELYERPTLLVDHQDIGRVVIELKFLPDAKKLAVTEVDQALVKASINEIDYHKLKDILNMAIEYKSADLVDPIVYNFFNSFFLPISNEYTNTLSLKSAFQFLKIDEIYNLLSKIARLELGDLAADTILKVAASKRPLDRAKTDRELTIAAEKALQAIFDRGDLRQEGLDPDNVIGLGLAYSPNGPLVKTVFGPCPKGTDETSVSTNSLADVRELKNTLVSPIKNNIGNI
ncbi:MAG: AAA family ATPase [Deltaproteobacteria bacterium]|jgi:hypothetical protein|nr:AAA family ATPase [Deltaproteobacteria bacterium]